MTTLYSDYFEELKKSSPKQLSPNMSLSNVGELNSENEISISSRRRDKDIAQHENGKFN